MTVGLRLRSGGSEKTEPMTHEGVGEVVGEVATENGERKNSVVDVVAEAVEAVQGDWALTHEEMRELGQAPFGTHHGRRVGI